MAKSKTTAAILALVGGSLGIHKFYLNDPGSGIFYAMLGMISRGFFSFPISAMLGVIDAIRLFSMSTAKFDAQYNKGNTRRRTRQSRSSSRTTQRTQRDMMSERDRNKYAASVSKKQRKNPFRKSADQKYKEYDLEGALEDYAKATEITEADKEMHFNMACIYSLLEKTDKSLFHLEQAISMGYKDIESIKTVDELAYVRIQPEFDSFVSNGYKSTRKQQTITPPPDDLLQDDLLLSQLNKLKELRSKGMLSEKEFLYEKEKLKRR